MVATGYGRKLVGAAGAAVTEITCQAWGVRHGVPEARTIIDIGGQDSKLVRLHDDGTVADFADERPLRRRQRTVSGNARRATGHEVHRPGIAGRRGAAPATISSMCVVFAETEIVGLLASGVLPEDILAGVETAIATRIAAMAGRALAEPILFTGGVALVPGMGAALAAVLGHPVRIAPQPQCTCAWAPRCWRPTGRRTAARPHLSRPDVAPWWCTT